MLKYKYLIIMMYKKLVSDEVKFYFLSSSLGSSNNCFTSIFRPLAIFSTASSENVVPMVIDSISLIYPWLRYDTSASSCCVIPFS